MTSYQNNKTREASPLVFLVLSGGILFFNGAAYLFNEFCTFLEPFLLEPRHSPRLRMDFLCRESLPSRQWESAKCLDGYDSIY